MKKEMILEKWKTKTISLLMAGIMVFAMAPLGTAVAFADEEDVDGAEEPTVEAVEDVVVELPGEVASETPENVAVDVPEEATVQAAEVEAKGALKDLGVYTMDLSKGIKKLRFDMNNPTPEMMAAYYMMQLTRGVEGKDYFYGESGQEGTYIDLDGQGEAFDLLMYADPATYQEGPDGASFDICFSKLDTTNNKDGYIVMLTEEGKAYFESVPADYLPAGYTGYYSGIKFAFKSTAPVKKANTLTVKAKKATKIKAKKMKKKAKSFNISKFMTVSGAQGAVTYAKAAGNKKITVASNGKVTLQKKIKKGTYKVTVNVTAAGNGSYSKVTKAVTFTVKVKK